MVDAAIDRLSGRTSNIGHLAKMTTNSTARKPHPALIILAIVVPLCSCATDERRSQGADRAGAAATTSAMVVALPLIPVVQLYHTLTGSSQRWKDQAEERRRIFDPIYEKRITMLSERDPVADAQMCWTSGESALLPSLPQAALYPGVEKERANQVNREQNFAAIERSELLSYLLRLMDRDPEHATGNGVQYSGPVWSAFVKASWAYKAKFNSKMEHLRANKASAK
jgi:hypothetical protein